MSVIQAVRTPLDKMLNSFPDARLQSSGWYLNPDNPRFGFIEGDDGKIGLNPLTGKSPEQILTMGKPPLRLSDLYPTGGAGSYKPAYREKQLDLLALSDYLKLDPEFLYDLGYRDGYTYRNRMGRKTVCVKLGGYYDPEGNPHSKVKVRLSIDGKVRFLWDQNTPGEPIPCGLHRLGEARTKGYLIIGEGESDAATMWFHHIPFLGISGADAVRHLDVSLLHAIPRVYIIEEPDQAKKNSETGQGFYANMRTHLRNGGYDGEIYSIRWKQATGYKDPSNVHKGIYHECNQGEVAPFRAEIRAKFAEVIEKALARAIPEGNRGLATQEDPLPPDPPPALPADESERERWYKELLAVKASVLSPTHKVVMMVIILYSPIFNSATGTWWQVNADDLAPKAGVSKKTFLASLTYLTSTVPLFEKKHTLIWYTPEESLNPKRMCHTELFIQPSETAWIAYPSTYRVADGAEERNHGGAGRNDSGKKKCVECGSEELDLYELQYCRKCHYSHYIPLAVAPLDDSLAPIEPEPEPSPVDAVESTAVVLPMQDEVVEVENTPEKHSEKDNLGNIDTSIVNVTQVGYVTPPEQETLFQVNEIIQYCGEKLTIFKVMPHCILAERKNRSAVKIEANDFAAVKRKRLNDVAQQMDEPPSADLLIVSID